MAGSDYIEPSFIGSPQPRFVFLSRVDCMQLQKNRRGNQIGDVASEPNL
jgi:hypothetical protein